MFFDAILRGLKATSAADLLASLFELDWDAFAEESQAEFADVYEQVVKAGGSDAAGEVGLDRFRVDDPFTSKAMTGYVGERIKSVDATSKDELSAMVQGLLARDGGASLDQIRDAIMEKHADWESWRADRIARTEVAIAYNHGQVFAYIQAGVDKVEVADGGEDAEGEDADCDCAEVDGQVWSVEDALSNPVSHPNCVRSFSPVLPGDDAEEVDGPEPTDPAAIVEE